MPSFFKPATPVPYTTIMILDHPPPHNTTESGRNVRARTIYLAPVGRLVGLRREMEVVEYRRNISGLRNGGVEG